MNILFIVVSIFIVFVASEPIINPLVDYKYDEDCEYKCKIENYKEDGYNATKRNMTINCLIKLIDQNDDQIITEEEFEQFKTDHIKSWMKRKMARWSGYLSVLYLCNCNCDDKIDTYDMIASYKYCLGVDKAINEAYNLLCTSDNPQL